MCDNDLVLLFHRQHNVPLIAREYTTFFSYFRRLNRFFRQSARLFGTSRKQCISICEILRRHTQRTETPKPENDTKRYKIENFIALLSIFVKLIRKSDALRLIRPYYCGFVVYLHIIYVKPKDDVRKYPHP